MWTLSKVSLDFHPLKQLFLKNDNLYYFDKSSSKIYNRQELNETFVRNGVCYIFKKDKILKSNTILLQNTGYLILNEKLNLILSFCNIFNFIFLKTWL